MTEKMNKDNYEKQFDEKAEKELQKHDEKVGQRDALSSVVWAALLIWAGLVFLAANTGWVDQYLVSGFLTRYLPRGMFFFEPGVWSLIMLGAGIILLFEVIVRLSLPNFRSHVGGTLITAAIFTGIGLGNMFGWDIVWPFILIAIGISILLGNYLRKK